MRSLVFVVMLAACGQVTRGPAWPKSSAGSEDGGESLAPRPSAHELASSSSGDDSVVEVPAAKPAEKPAETAPAATTPTVTTPTEEPATTEEITIEIDDE